MFLFWYPDKIDLEEKYIENKRSMIKMFEIQERILNSDSANILIDATKCTYISSTCLAILSSIQLINKDIKIKFKKGTQLLNTLIDNRIYKY